MSQREIPFLFMRGGTSRGPYFNAADLPSDRDAIAAILLKAVGAGHPLNIDGIGGGNAVTNKVAML
ncbi:MAG: PrpF domain-containing protein, partial [Candidatus Puniceispirillaceae bacterium]